MTQLNTIENRSSIRPPEPPARSSSFEELFFKDDFLRIVLIGFAGGFGLSTLVILFSLEVTTLRTAMAEQLGTWWFMIPTSTVIGFALWTFMMLRIRRHRFVQMLRTEAFNRQADQGPDSESAKPTDFDETASQQDWL